VTHLLLPDDAKLTAERRSDLLNGVVVLKGHGKRFPEGSEGSIKLERTPLALIPYYAWNHRGANEMQVWIRRSYEEDGNP